MASTQPLKTCSFVDFVLQNCKLFYYINGPVFWCLVIRFEICLIKFKDWDISKESKLLPRSIREHCKLRETFTFFITTSGAVKLQLDVKFMVTGANNTFWPLWKPHKNVVYFFCFCPGRNLLFFMGSRANLVQGIQSRKTNWNLSSNWNLSNFCLSTLSIHRGLVQFVCFRYTVMGL